MIAAGSIRRFLSLACLASASCWPLAGHAGEARLLLASQVTGLTIVPLAQLSKAPPEAAEREGCEDHLVTPKTDAGRLVARQGWAVTGEAALGSYQTVSFVGGFEQGTSGSCDLSEGNIGFFQGGKLRALAYAPKGSTHSIGTIEALEGGNLRIWSGDLLPQPVADIRAFGPQAIVIAAVAAVDRVCQGTLSVPNVYGMEVALGRVVLAQYGWTPVAHGAAASRPEPRESGLADQGLPEVDSCSGTGFGYCSFDYQNGGNKLGVITVGDPEAPVTPSISGYAVTCAP